MLVFNNLKLLNLILFRFAFFSGFCSVFFQTVSVHLWFKGPQGIDTYISIKKGSKIWTPFKEQYYFFLWLSLTNVPCFDVVSCCRYTNFLIYTPRMFALAPWAGGGTADECALCGITGPLKLLRAMQPPALWFNHVAHGLWVTLLVIIGHS